MRFITRAAGAVLAVVAAVAFNVVAFPGLARAACDGKNIEHTDSLVVNGSTYVTEDPVSGTCNDNNYYQSNFRSNYSGWRASVHIKNGVDWVDFWGLYDTSWYYLSYTDYNSHSLIVLCLDNGKTYWCGWGGNSVSGSGVQHTWSGTNDGY